MLLLVESVVGMDFCCCRTCISYWTLWLIIVVVVVLFIESSVDSWWRCVIWTTSMVSAGIVKSVPLRRTTASAISSLIDLTLIIINNRHVCVIRWCPIIRIWVSSIHRWSSSRIMLLIWNSLINEG